MFLEVVNKPKAKPPYSREIVATRELLLLAQSALEKIENGEKINFHAELFKKVMKFYHHQKNA